MHPTKSGGGGRGGGVYTGYNMGVDVLTVFVFRYVSTVAIVSQFF